MALGPTVARDGMNRAARHAGATLDALGMRSPEAARNISGDAMVSNPRTDDRRTRNSS